MVKCCNCNFYGHYSSDCPDWVTREGVDNVNINANDTINDNNESNAAPYGDEESNIITVMDL